MFSHGFDRHRWKFDRSVWPIWPLSELTIWLIYDSGRLLHHDKLILFSDRCCVKGNGACALAPSVTLVCLFRPFDKRCADTVSQHLRRRRPQQILTALATSLHCGCTAFADTSRGRWWILQLEKQLTLRFLAMPRYDRYSTAPITVFSHSSIRINK